MSIFDPDRSVLDTWMSTMGNSHRRLLTSFLEPVREHHRASHSILTKRKVHELPVAHHDDYDIIRLNTDLSASMLNNT